jgi:hypothetical protein
VNIRGYRYTIGGSDPQCNQSRSYPNWSHGCGHIDDKVCMVVKAGSTRHSTAAAVAVIHSLFIYGSAMKERSHVGAKIDMHSF